MMTNMSMLQAFKCSLKKKKAKETKKKKNKKSMVNNILS